MTFPEVTDADWESALQEFGAPVRTYAEYIEPIRDLCNKHNYKPGDRPEIFRDVFNALVASCPTQETLRAFYQSDVFSRLCAYECPHTNTLDALAMRGKQALLSFGDTRFTSNIFRFLDHGCGPCHVGLAVAEMIPSARVYFYDFSQPHRLAIRNAMRRCENADRFRFKFIDKNSFRFWEQENIQFDCISSLDVMEHLPDPVAEVRSLASALLPGGVANICVYFNSDKGRDPSHLVQHEHYEWAMQDWIDSVQAAGLRALEATQRGVTLFIKPGNGI